MDLRISFKKLGEKRWTEKTLKLSNEWEPLVRKYSIQLVEYEKMDVLGVFVQRKEQPLIDVFSHTIYRPWVSTHVPDAFRKLYDEIKKTEEEKTLGAFFKNLANHIKGEKDEKTLDS